ncbi:hypothetical protein [Streptomyces sp. NBC_01304]|uniref:hypothetical protein n=1 Tax=Streptomyces sp. NBC_01304 TaxID=2903818 RepID=UPI002E0D9275|nr:hypothetical protein OG430_11835 [Streptomyces sp. NBC_01304]
MTPAPPHRAALSAAAVLLAVLGSLAGCASPREPTVSLSPDDTLKAAQLVLTDRCLTRQGLTPPRPGKTPPRGAEGRRVDHALFGTGRAELQLKLPSGHVVGQHTDGCLAAAQERLYGDQRGWFQASTTVNNLKSRAPRQDRAAYRELRAHALAQATAILTRELREPEERHRT